MILCRIRERPCGFCYDLPDRALSVKISGQTAKKRLGMGAVSLVLLIFILDSVRTQINGVLYSTFSRDCSSFIIMASVCIFYGLRNLNFQADLSTELPEMFWQLPCLMNIFSIFETIYRD